MSRITFSVSNEEHKLIKAKAALNGLTMRDYFLVLHKNENEKLFNMEAIEDATQELEDPDKRKKLETYKISKKLWKDLGRDCFLGLHKNEDIWKDLGY